MRPRVTDKIGNVKLVKFNLVLRNRDRLLNWVSGFCRTPSGVTTSKNNFHPIIPCVQLFFSFRLNIGCHSSLQFDLS